MDRPHAHRSRSILLLAVLVALAGELAAGVLLDRAPLHIRFPAAARIVNSLQRLKSAKNILFFGSSRFGNDVNAETVTRELRAAGVGDGASVFNAFVTAGDPVAMEFLTDKLLAADIRPSIAVIELLPEVLARRNLWLHFHLARQFRWPEVWKTLPEAYRSGKLSTVIAARIMPVYLFRGELQRWALQVLNPSSSPSTLEGENTPPRQQAPVDADTLQEGAVKARRILRDFKIGGLSAQALERLLERLRISGAIVVLVGPPITSPYRRAHQAPVEAAFLSYMQRLGEKYGARFFDYRDRLADDRFYTRYYATTDGSVHFSRLLAREVLVPLLARTDDEKRSAPELSPDAPAKPGIAAGVAPEIGPRRGG